MRKTLVTLATLALFASSSCLAMKSWKTHRNPNQGYSMISAWREADHSRWLQEPPGPTVTEETIHTFDHKNKELWQPLCHFDTLFFCYYNAHSKTPERFQRKEQASLPEQQKKSKPARTMRVARDPLTFLTERLQRLQDALLQLQENKIQTEGDWLESILLRLEELEKDITEKLLKGKVTKKLLKEFSSQPGQLEERLRGEIECTSMAIGILKSRENNKIQTIKKSSLGGSARTK